MSMIDDDVLLNKSASIERCLTRIDEEYSGHEHELRTNFIRQDAIILNILRACEAAIDTAMHIVRIKKLGIPQESRDAFTLLNKAGLLDDVLTAQMQAMVGFHNIAVHDYQKLNIDIVEMIVKERVAGFRCLVAVALKLR